ncbi:uncharacterized protein SPPG_02563 [Spizellomyces punctatus DAOM BR117]|uniref:Uncharacterized protein n=1 Tax=Spizellomyces punctatus (strain DAOM BR117) TaxID=645134 RepID=A0A0L0HMD1_SPIPD|nr:uncharacterized protein SPPG_02563 [Spizellomyces punctatus DAOM BR117]KND02060.1 hypothetical protein SPPG_02563 [Spizellomyces punctatus DAOM BR117]|eukprot:XP_016610099.1 hypothetical protein SPPG_02563 [Spizellomyces punctatus DAOM BR117]
MTTDCTSTTTGSFQVKGGVGIAKSLYIGGDVYTNGVKLATESSLTASVATKQNASPLLDAISGLTTTPNTFIMGASNGFTATPVSTILGGYQPLLTTSSSLNVNSLMTSGGIFVQGAMDMVFRVDNVGNGLLTGGLLVEKDLNVEGLIIQNGVKVAMQQWAVAMMTSMTTPLSQSLTLLQTLVQNNKTAADMALATKQSASPLLNSISGLIPAANTFIMGTPTGFSVVPTSNILSSYQPLITSSTALSFNSATVGRGITIQNGAASTTMSLVNTGSNITWGMRVAGSTGDGTLSAGGFGLNSSYNNTGFVLRVSNTGVMQIPNTTDSSSVTTGAFQVSGGVGIGKTLTLGAGGGGLQPAAIVINAPSSATASMAVLISNNAASSNSWGIYHAATNGTGILTNGSLGFYNYGTSAHQFILKANGTIAITSTTDSSSTITGALQVSGGAGIAKSLYVGGDIFSNNLKLATESYVGMAIANKQASSPLLSSISGLALSANSFIVGSSATSFSTKTVEEVKSILGVTNVDLSGKQNASPLLDSIASMSPMSNMFLMGDDVQGFTLANDVTVRSILNIVNYAPSISALQTSKQDVIMSSSNLLVNTILANDTSDAQTVSSGALQVKGGIGVSKSIFSGGNITGKVLIAASTGGYFKLRSDTPSMKGDYTISYNNSGDALHVHLAGSSDSIDQHRYEFDLILSGNLTIGLPLNGLRAIILKNLDPGTNACAIQYFQNAAGSAVMFLNGNNRSVDGGVNTFTIRNDAGGVRLQAQGAKGITIASSTGNVIVESTTPALSSTTGALVVNGGVAVGAHVVAGGNLYSNGPVYSNGQVCATQSWVTGQTFLRNVQVFKLLTKDVWQSNNASKVFYVSTPGKVLMEWTIRLHGNANSNGTLSIFLGQSAGSMPLVYASDFNFNSGINTTLTATFILTGMADNVAYFTNFSISQAAPDNTTDVTLIKITELGP